jgi:hypothetical protein
MMKSNSWIRVSLVAVALVAFACVAVTLWPRGKKPASPDSRSSSSSESAPRVQSDDRPSTPSAAPARLTAQGSEPPASAGWQERDAAAGEFDVETLRRALRSSNEFERIRALEHAVDARLVEALPLLEQSALPSDPHAAPAIVDAIAELAASASQEERDRAADTLGRWTQQESLRAETGARDARGNVAALVQALGTIHSPASVDALTRALDARRLPLHVETVAVQGLVELGDARALEAVERFSARLAALPESTGFEEELRREATLAASTAKTRLGS